MQKHRRGQNRDVTRHKENHNRRKVCSRWKGNYDFPAIFSNENDLSFLPHPVDKDACKKYRKELRTDQASFEDYAYQFQEEFFKKNKEKGE